MLIKFECLQRCLNHQLNHHQLNILWASNSSSRHVSQSSKSFVSTQLYQWSCSPHITISTYSQHSINAHVNTDINANLPRQPSLFTLNIVNPRIVSLNTRCMSIIRTKEELIRNTKTHSILLIILFYYFIISFFLFLG